MAIMLPLQGDICSWFVFLAKLAYIVLSYVMVKLITNIIIVKLIVNDIFNRTYWLSYPSVSEIYVG